ncbi:cytochrome P450 [Suillus clintonianus]|uniref:cytochrome P450 n=1 Tax=Suillus clintonianus TaxID=1904413 RepID=UPI001B879855|nr:cytochrome P450 [Suillus clintonianus]KAG2147549.1 cytochrome P450 [Suillus clintonianus]
MAASSDFRLPALAAISAVAYGLVSWWSQKKRNPGGLPLPPGPKPLPVVGNVLGIKIDEPWVTYTHWGATYGELVYSRLLNQEIILINTEEVARDLLERRSNNYSDRPGILCLTNDFFGWSFNSVMIKYNDRWRLHRRLFHQAFRPEAAFTYQSMQLRKARELLINLLEDSVHWRAHFQTHSASIIMSVVYGYETAPRDDPIISIVEKAVNLAVSSIKPEVAAFLGAFPFLQYIPSWFPGASFKRTAVLSTKYAEDMIEAPFQYVETNMARSAAPSMVADSLRRAEDEIVSETYVKAVKETAVTAFAAASETTASTLLIFILAMLQNPKVQARAQAEIDSVVGSVRLPNFEDRASLPYVEAVLREVLRWHPAVPLSIPHAATHDDVYNGYFIPQGATIITNTWAITHNEAKYPNPDEFKPERFFDADGQLNNDTVSFAFGAGRRICVGRYIADASMWSAMVSVLAVFDIKKCQDEQGNNINVNPKFTAGITSHPLPFPCRVVPRNKGLSTEKLTQMY